MAIRTFLTDFILMAALWQRGVVSYSLFLLQKYRGNHSKQQSTQPKGAFAPEGVGTTMECPAWQDCIPVRADRKLILCPREKQRPSKCTHLRIEVEDQLLEERLWSQRLLLQRQMGKLSEADSFFQSHFLFIHSSSTYPFLLRLGDCQLRTDSRVK